jgi:hypothetical protein
MSGRGAVFEIGEQEAYEKDCGLALTGMLKAIQRE